MAIFLYLLAVMHGMSAVTVLGISETCSLQYGYDDVQQM